MWLFINLLSVTTLTVLTAWYFGKLPNPTNSYRVTKNVYKVIQQNGFYGCLQWARQIIAYQLGRRLVEIHHKYYIINYPYGVTWYKIIVPRRRGPCRIDEITDGDGNDVKKEVTAYLGPSHNFHGVTVTPTMLGYDSLTFTYLTGEPRTFLKSQDINIY